jgi:hypothetical protein
LRQIKGPNKNVNDVNRIVLADPVFKAFRKQRALNAIRPLNEAPHPILPQAAREPYRENQIQQRIFTQPGSFAAYPPSARTALCPLLLTTDKGLTAFDQQTPLSNVFPGN